MTGSTGERILRFVNALIALALLAVAAGLFWFVWRPLPRRSGTIETGVGAAASVSFDPRGMPHIRASSLEDALFVQGYVTAQDRLFQMDSLRRLSAGDLAEIVGPAALESDRDSRRLRMRRIAEQAYVTMPAADRAILAAYARGVNAFISTHLSQLPLEFTLLGYQPRPWSVVDSVLLSLYMFRDLTTSWRNELTLQRLLGSGEAGKIRYLYDERALAAPLPGSNAWVLAGSRTASGKPLLSNDMHLAYSIPSIWYMTRITAPGMDVSGVTVPGLPGVIVGHNQNIAWGITNLETDVQNLFVEKIDPQNGQYLFDGRVEQARLEREIIPVKGKPSVELNVWVTRHGPLLVAEGNQAMSLRWTAAEPGLLQYPILDIDRAQDWAQFTTALARFPGPAANYVYADRAGNIGYHAAGRVPLRRGYQGDLPVDGSTSRFDWDGFIPFDKLPSAFNPPSGIIATANQDPFPNEDPLPKEYSYPPHGFFAPPNRARQIRARLAAHGGWRAADLLGVEKDVYSEFDKFLAGEVVGAYQRHRSGNTALDAAATLLAGWNGQMETDSAAAFLESLVFQHVRTAVWQRAAPGANIDTVPRFTTASIERLLRERPAGWFSDYDTMLLTAFLDAFEEAQRIQGRDPKRWKYGAYSTITIRNPVLHQAPWVGRYFDIGPAPMSGSPVTVKQFTRALGPSMRMNADLADWDRSLLNIVTGQSGQVLSSHYRDQWDSYYHARSYPMPWNSEEISSTLEFRPER
ncbi:MAG: penicillin acylase family protein [Bryobacteraceae bacterium]|jgi:penicillin amidase